MLDGGHKCGERTLVNNYVVTGAAGFIGSQIVERLLRDGVPPEQIVAVDISKKLFAERRCSRHFGERGIKFVEHIDFLARYWKSEIAPCTIFHMGACSSTDETRQDFLDEHNLNYSKKLWQIASKSKTKFIYASSAATYGAGEQGFVDDPEQLKSLKPLNLYGWSKQNFDLYVLEESRAGRAPPVWAGLKFFNVYGPGEWHKGRQASVVFHAREQVKASGSLKLFQSHKTGVKDGEQKRDFVYVDDCVDVCMVGAQGMLRPGIYNVGSGTARTFIDLGRAVFKALGVAEKIEFIPTPEPLREHYQYYTCASLTRLEAAGFQRPMTSLEEGVKTYLSLWEN